MSQTLDSVAIRRIEPSDFTALASFLERNNTSEVRRYFSPFPLDEDTARKICLEDHRDLFFVAIREKQIIGLSMLRGWDEGFHVPSFGILIDRFCTGRGIGRRMTEFTIKEAREASCEHVRLTVYASNIRAVELYRSVGFVKTASQPVRWGDQSDVKIVMMKALQP
jgi:[ribosomal protein S18]-alanine N-acetyltransferase